MAKPGARSERKEPDWPAAAGRRVVFLLDAASPLEARLLRDWIERLRPAGAARDEAVAIPPSRRRRRRRLDPRLEPLLAAGDDPLLAPLRVAWRAAERDGVRAARLADLLTPRRSARSRTGCASTGSLRAHPERCRIVAGEPAPASELRERWRARRGSDAGQTIGLAEFVARQAQLALERAERRLRGARYKVPRFVHEDILVAPGVPRRPRGARARASARPRSACANARRATCARSPPPTAPS